jgi:hypothetical protein
MEGIFFPGEAPDYCKSELPRDVKDQEQQSINNENTPKCDPAKTDCVQRGSTQRATRNAIRDSHTTRGAAHCRHNLTPALPGLPNLLHFPPVATLRGLGEMDEEHSR